MCDVTTVA